VLYAVLETMDPAAAPGPTANPSNGSISASHEEAGISRSRSEFRNDQASERRGTTTELYERSLPLSLS
jgi:hypothetical protein